MNFYMYLVQYLSASHSLIQIVGGFIVQIFFALAVLADAVKIQDQGHKMVFVSGKIWALGTLCGGVFIVLAYWIIHHSTLRSSVDSDQNSKPVSDVPPRGPVYDY
ncbi:MAG: hypothetical protein WCO68_00720 [Verrucomicrobiota bacterium]